MGKHILKQVLFLFFLVCFAIIFMSCSGDAAISGYSTDEAGGFVNGLLSGSSDAVGDGSGVTAHPESFFENENAPEMWQMRASSVLETLSSKGIEEIKKGTEIVDGVEYSVIDRVSVSGGTFSYTFYRLYFLNDTLKMVRTYSHSASCAMHPYKGYKEYSCIGSYVRWEKYTDSGFLEESKTEAYRSLSGMYSESSSKYEWDDAGFLLKRENYQEGKKTYEYDCEYYPSGALKRGIAYSCDYNSDYNLYLDDVSDYDENGIMRGHASYNADGTTNTRVEFSENGSLKKNMEYRNGVLRNVELRYESGRLRQETEYDEYGALERITAYYDKDGYNKKCSVVGGSSFKITDNFSGIYVYFTDENKINTDIYVYSSCAGLGSAYAFDAIKQEFTEEELNNVILNQDTMEEIWKEMHGSYWVGAHIINSNKATESELISLDADLLASVLAERGIEAEAEDFKPYLSRRWVLYNANGLYDSKYSTWYYNSTKDVQTFKAEEPFVLKERDSRLIKRDYSTFTGWNTKADGTGISYADGAEVVFNEDVKLYAQWEKVNIVFHANGGCGNMELQQVFGCEKTPLDMCAFTRSGYVFTGWNTKADGSGDFYGNCQIVEAKWGLVLYAQWVPAALSNGAQYIGGKIFYVAGDSVQGSADGSIAVDGVTYSFYDKDGILLEDLSDIQNSQVVSRTDLLASAVYCKISGSPAHDAFYVAGMDDKTNMLIFGYDGNSFVIWAAGEEDLTLYPDEFEAYGLNITGTTWSDLGIEYSNGMGSVVGRGKTNTAWIFANRGSDSRYFPGASDKMTVWETVLRANASAGTNGNTDWYVPNEAEYNLLIKSFESDEEYYGKFNYVSVLGPVVWTSTASNDSGYARISTRISFLPLFDRAYEAETLTAVLIRSF